MSSSSHIGIDFACEKSERFGLLGINGAGKSTTLGVLTADLQATVGTVCIAGKDISHPQTKRYIGYCPQQDPLLELMTAHETLEFFGRIRGLVGQELTTRVDNLIAQTGLTKHAYKPCGTYSGGNKRKLSLAIALIGDPRLLLLDEPSTGTNRYHRFHFYYQDDDSDNQYILISASASCSFDSYTYHHLPSPSIPLTIPSSSRHGSNGTS